MTEHVCIVIEQSSTPEGEEADPRSPVDTFEPQAMTHMLVVSDPEKSRVWYVKVLDATVDTEYRSSVVLKLQDTWLLLVEGGGPTPR